jgi:hypothetical protein
MYPASRLWLLDAPAPEGFYLFEDLPDEIVVLGLESNSSNGMPVPITLPKVEVPVVGEEETTIYLNLTDGTLQPNQSIDPISVIYRNDDSENPFWQGLTDSPFTGGFPCLIDPGFFEDTFEDTYAVAVSDPADYYAPSITRVGLCEWYGDGVNQESDVIVFYWNGVDEFNFPDTQGEPQHGWYLTLGVPFSVRKNDPQNGPTGTYEFSGGPTVVIS